MISPACGYIEVLLPAGIVPQLHAKLCMNVAWLPIRVGPIRHTIWCPDFLSTQVVPSPL